MRVHLSRGLAFAAALIGAAACSSSAGEPEASFPPAPYVTIMSDGGKFRLELRTAPDQPLTRGTSAVLLTVFDAATNLPRDDLAITVVPWMAAMAHGSSVRPAITPEGHGAYVLKNVSFFMPGRWELRISFDGGATDTASPALDVQ